VSSKSPFNGGVEFVLASLPQLTNTTPEKKSTNNPQFPQFNEWTARFLYLLDRPKAAAATRRTRRIDRSQIYNRVFAHLSPELRIFYSKIHSA
jgi:hypothetical protein